MPAPRYFARKRALLRRTLAAVTAPHYDEPLFARRAAVMAPCAIKPS